MSSLLKSRFFVIGCCQLAAFWFLPTVFGSGQGAGATPLVEISSSNVGGGLKVSGSPGGSSARAGSSEARIPLLSQARFGRLGVILPSFGSMGSIVRNPNQRVALATGDIVYIDLGTEKGVKRGGRFSIVSKPRAIYPPKPIDYAPALFLDKGWSGYMKEVLNVFSLREDLHTYRKAELGYEAETAEPSNLKSSSNWLPFQDKPIGYLVKIMGVLEVLEARQGFSKAVIVKAFRSITIGSRLTPYKEQEVPELPVRYHPPIKDIHGLIVALEKDFSMVGVKDIVYIDKGQAQNVAPGDRFEIYAFTEAEDGGGRWYDFSWLKKKRVTPLVIGELQVVATQETTATAIIRKHSQEMSVGQRVRYVPMLAMDGG